VTGAALYTPEGDHLVASEYTQGPWSADAQHGGPVAALLARAVEAVPSPVPMQVVRLTVELLRPVPIAALFVAAKVIRDGRRVQLIDARISVSGEDVALARALRIRTTSLRVPIPGPAPVAEPPEDVPETRAASLSVPYAAAVELRFTRGSWDTPGPVQMWTRLKVPVVAGEQATPLQRTAAAADFGNGVSSVLDFATHVFINPDLTVSLARLPVGEWIGFDVASRISPDGWGQAEAAIFDRSGWVGRSSQSLFIDER
jgi:acyl-Coa thioesterase superfamily protein/acyl-CoA thioesterase superfamily protein